LTAVFKDTLKQFTVTFNNYDGKMLYRAVVDAGSNVTYLGSTPTKAGTESLDYTFTGWDKELTNILADTVITAQFESAPKTLYVSFKNDDGTLLKTETVKYGEAVAYTGATPTKERTAQYTYSFAGWDKTLSNITVDCERWATYSEKVNQYTVTFKNYDGSELKKYTVAYGSAVIFDGTTPVKPADDDSGYAFVGWDAETSFITSDVVATAKFQKADYLDYVLSSGGNSYVVYRNSAVSLPSILSIPATHLSKPVSAIGDSAFKSCGSLSSLILPENITKIGDSAFQLCSNISSFSISPNLVSIGDHAFSDDVGLVSVGNQSKLVSISANAFSGCTALATIAFPALQSMGEGAFYGCTSLDNVLLPNTLTSVGISAFSRCSSLSSIVTPNSLTSLPKQMFDVCTGLASISFSSKLQTIGSGTFYGCSSLKTISIPSSVTMIDEWAFSHCTSLESVNLGTGVQSLGYQSFSSDASLASISLPSSISSISSSVFTGSSSLESVTFAGTVANFTSAIGSNSSSSFQNTKVQSVVCSNGSFAV
jgi:hypothetical protein